MNRKVTLELDENQLFTLMCMCEVAEMHPEEGMEDAYKKVSDIVHKKFDETATQYDVTSYIVHKDGNVHESTEGKHLDKEHLDNLMKALRKQAEDMHCKALIKIKAYANEDYDIGDDEKSTFEAIGEYKLGIVPMLNHLVNSLNANKINLTKALALYSMYLNI